MSWEQQHLIVLRNWKSFNLFWVVFCCLGGSLLQGEQVSTDTSKTRHVAQMFICSSFNSDQCSWEVTLYLLNVVFLLVTAHVCVSEQMQWGGGGRPEYVHALCPEGKDFFRFYCQVVNTLTTPNLSDAPRRWEVYSTRAHIVEQMMVRQFTELLRKVKTL